MLVPFDLSTWQDRVSFIINKFAGYMSELYSNPETHASLSRLVQAVEEAGPSTGSAPAVGAALPRQSPAALEDMASKLPKGLRVEDLKPPPTKRQKGKAGAQGPGQSPSVQTPDPKTPSVAADSPIPVPGSATSANKKAAAGAGANKRKRQASTTQPPKTGAAAAARSAAAAAALAPMSEIKPPLPPVQAQVIEPVNEYKVFFDAREALENGASDPLDALSQALKDLEAAQADLASQHAHVLPLSGAPPYGLYPQPSSATTNGPGSASATATIVPSAPATVTAAVADGTRTPTDDELFSEFMDFNGDPFPIPELLVDVSDDYSPESIRTVGRSDSVGQPQSATGIGIGNGTSANWSFGPTVVEGQTPTATSNTTKTGEITKMPGQANHVDDDDNEGIEMPQSPEGRYFNGVLFLQ